MITHHDCLYFVLFALIVKTGKHKKIEIHYYFVEEHNLIFTILQVSAILNLQL